MTKKKDSPDGKTPFALLMGCTDLGKFDKQTKTYIVKTTKINPKAVNFFKTLHGGAIAGLLDDACGMCIYNLYGENSAITESAFVSYKNFIVPKSSIIISSSINKEIGNKIHMAAQVETNKKIIATMQAIWLKRIK